MKVFELLNTIQLLTNSIVALMIVPSLLMGVLHNFAKGFFRSVMTVGINCGKVMLLR